MKMTAQEFLIRHNMSPEQIDPAFYGPQMAKSMEEGLEKDGCMLPMIPTYLKNSGEVPQDVSAVVIDAGGTNYRCALARFSGGKCVISEMKKMPMPGIGKSATWEEFICFVADSIMSYMDRADKIGFCFSYSADITPEIDGRVIRIDKEVVVTGSEGKLVGASLLAELERRGCTGKSVVILNDTAAVLLGVCYAATAIETSLLVRSCFGSKDYTVITSRVSAFGAGFAVIGSPLWGLIAEGPLGYIPVLAIGAVSCAVSIVAGNMALNGAKKLEG